VFWMEVKEVCCIFCGVALDVAALHCVWVTLMLAFEASERGVLGMMVAID